MEIGLTKDEHDLLVEHRRQTRRRQALFALNGQCTAEIARIVCELEELGRRRSKANDVINLISGRGVLK